MPSVFISHRSTDAHLAEKLATDLRNAGHVVWLDAWEISVGDDIVERISDGLERSAYLVTCFSAAGMAPWMDKEWMSALARQMNGAHVKILPVRLTGTEAPAILAGTKYADLIKDWDQGVADLLRAMR
ncbi:MAG TPA: toll/interleukin-1 receptor domain-containing protein [Thermoanaerobaculia bacterium]|nr:toll/interleukin-1 receptor domain-containing protein [Thermoanaerobaculia bacterium]